MIFTKIKCFGIGVGSSRAVLRVCASGFVEEHADEDAGEGERDEEVSDGEVDDLKGEINVHHDAEQHEKAREQAVLLMLKVVIGGGGGNASVHNVEA